jgi:aspartate/methionine/tyrosine aminotransferase
MGESRRMRMVQSPIIPVVGDLIKRHPCTISLGQGVASYGPPPQAAERMVEFTSDIENHKYKSFDGIPELREKIAAKLRAENGIVVDNDSRIVVTAGANMGFVNALLAIADPGDEIILNVPYYFNHEMAVTMADCKVVCVSTDDNYQLQPDAISDAVTDRTRAVVTISPNNPTGAVYDEGSLREVNAICGKNGVYHISDEPYEYFMYNGATHFSPGSIDGAAEHTISLFSLSKAYGFASWRIGYMVIPDHLFMPVRKVQDTVLICPPVVSQWGAVGAMEAGVEYCRKKMAHIVEVRHIVQNALAEIGDIVTVPPAEGAFYFLLRVATDMDAMDLVERLIREYKVAVVPGMTFGIEDGCYLRVAYGALETETAAEGIGRLVDGLRHMVGSE